MTLYGIGLGPGQPDLVTVRGKRILERAAVVYSPGRLSRSVALEHVDEEKIGDLEFPMTTDEEELREAWKAAAATVAPRAREEDVAFVTLGDPNVYSTFGHLRRTMAAFHPDVDLEIVPGVSSVTAFATALDVEIEAGAGLSLREAANGAAPVGPDRLVLFKVTDVPTTHEKLVDAGYDVTYGRRLFMEQGETLVTDDPTDLEERDYYTLAYAEKRDLEIESATAVFTQQARDDSSEPAGIADESGDGTDSSGDGRRSENASSAAGEAMSEREKSTYADGGHTDVAALERTEGCEAGDCEGHR